jgi:hypothetical protein
MVNLTTNSNNPYLRNSVETPKQESTANPKVKSEEKDIISQIEKSAVEVSISMNAQFILFAMDAGALNKNNMSAQKELFDFLSGKVTESGYSLEDIGYEGKPITELSPEEASELVSENGFFGVTQTSDRVSSFVLSFAGDDPEALEKAIEGIKKGFEEAEEMWGGALPDISYKTQDRTLEILNTRLAELQGDDARPEETE